MVFELLRGSRSTIKTLVVGRIRIELASKILTDRQRAATATADRQSMEPNELKCFVNVRRSLRHNSRQVTNATYWSFADSVFGTFRLHIFG